MRTFAFELRQAFRALVRSPGYALTAIAMLGAGLGLSMYMFGAIDTFMLRPLPFANADRIAHVELADLATGEDSIEVPLPEYLAMARSQRSFDAFGAFSTGTLNLSGDGRPERFDGGFVTDGLFDALGAKTAMGREFVPADYVPGAPRVVVIGHELWQNRYAGAADIVGRTIRANGKPATIVGVMPEGFAFPFRQQVWTTSDLDPDGPAKGFTYEVIGRMRDGTGYAQAAADLDAIVRAMPAVAGDRARDGLRSVVKSLNAEYMGRNTPAVLTTMMVAVLLVLLIACVNVANLMIARTVERARELAIHGALGAVRARILLRLLLEGLLVAIAAGAIGMLLAQAGGKATMDTLTQEENGLPYWFQYALEWRSVAFAIGVALFAALAATLVPALRASRDAVGAGVREGGRGATSRGFGRFSRVLITAELALSAVLLVVAGLTVRSILAMQYVDPGADTHGVLSARIALFEDAYPQDAQVAAFFAELRNDLAAQPGVAAAAVTTSVPLSFSGGTYYRREGQDVPDGQRAPVAWLVGTTAEYFDAFRIPVTAGRNFGLGDDAGAPAVALVNRRFAERVFGNESPLGQRVDLDPAGPQRKWVQIVGVVGNVMQGEPEDDPGGAIYVPFAQRPQRYASIALRSAGGDPYALADVLRGAVAKLDADLPVYFVRTADDWIAAATVPDRLMSKMFVVFAAFGTLLAAAGIYALLAFAVAQRTREIGVRRALGAVDAGIVRLVMGQGMRQLVVGLALGLVLGMALALVLRNVLFGVGVFDPVTFAVVAVVLAASMFLASWAPTRRALRIEPMEALRYE